MWWFRLKVMSDCVMVVIMFEGGDGLGDGGDCV